MNDIEYQIKWDKTKSDGEGYTTLCVEYIYSLTRTKKCYFVSMRGIEGPTQLKNKLDSIGDIYNCEVGKCVCMMEL
jgi:hypothetical protein